MLDQVETEDGPMPGIFPLPISRAESKVLAELNERFHAELMFYHFDYSESYLRPDWKKVLAMPLHSEIELDKLDSVLKYATRLMG